MSAEPAQVADHSPGQAISASTESESSSTQVLRLGLLSGEVSASKQSPYYRWLDYSLRQHGLRVELAFLPGKRLLHQVDQGLIDGDLSRTPAAVRGFKHLLQVPEPFLRTCYMGFALKPDVADVTKVGAMRGALKAEALARKHWGDDAYVPLNDFEQGTRLLIAGRLDVILLPSFVQNSLFAKRLEARIGLKLQAVTPVMAEFDTFIYLHDSHEALAPALAQTLRASRDRFLKSSCDF